MCTSARTLATLFALLTLVPAIGGCNEVGAMLDEGAGKNDEAKPEAAATGGQSAREKLDAYYKREPREVEQDPNDPIVPCQLPSGTQFMRKNDCYLRGGHSG